MGFPHVTITPPPETSILRPINPLRYTKLISIVSTFLIFSHFTFQAEAYINPLTIRRLHESKPTARKRDSPDEYFDEDDIPTYVDPNVVPHPVVNSGDPIAFHENRIAESIARELFFHPTEAHYYESRWLDFFAAWSVESRSRYNERLVYNPGLSTIEFFLYDQIRWEGGHCGVQYVDGCIGMPSAVEVRRRLPENRHRARQVIYTIEAFRRVHTDSMLLRRALEVARDRMTGYCQEFAHVFFHPPTHHKKKMCVAQIIGIVIGIIVGIVLGWDFVIPPLKGRFILPRAVINSELTTLIPTIEEVSRAALETALEGATDSQLGTKALEVAESISTPAEVSIQGEIVVLGEKEAFIPPTTASETSSEIKPGSTCILCKVKSPSTKMMDKARAVWKTIRDGFRRPSQGKSPKLLTRDYLQRLLHADGIESMSIYEALDILKGQWVMTNDKSVQEVSHFPIESSRTRVKRYQSSTTKLIVRKRPLFAIVPASISELSKSESYGATKELEERIRIQLRHADGIPMNHSDVLSFFNRNSRAISRFTTLLRRADNTYYDKDPVDGLNSLTRRSEFVVRANVEHVPWTMAFGNATLERVHASKSDANPALQFKFVEQGSKKPKGSVNEEWKQIPAAHKVTGIATALSAFNLAHPPKRIGGRNLHEISLNLKIDDDSLFHIDIDGERFRNSIKHQKCATDNYTGDTRKNEQECRDILKEVAEHIVQKVENSLHEINDASWVDKNWREGFISPVAIYLYKRYHSYDHFIAFDQLQRQPEILENKLFERMKNSLVTKAYADEGCYLKCTSTNNDGSTVVRGPEDRPKHIMGNTACLSGCYDPTEQKFERLYGLQGAPGQFGRWDASNGPATQQPWNMSEARISTASLQAYLNRNPVGYFPGYFDSNPYEMLVKDFTPILPVCRSELQRLTTERKKHSKGDKRNGYFPCTCGNKYGSESEVFWKASNWDSNDKHFERDRLKDCHEGPLKGLAGSHPAAYLVNFCQIYYIAVAPPGTNSWEEKHDKGHYTKNKIACNHYLNYYRDNHQQPDHVLNVGMCKLWSKYSIDHHRGIDHKRDFSYANSALFHGGCAPYKDFWKSKKGCHYGQKSCDMPNY